ncbi:DUF192 domain-containing protein [Leekyejoonella antrihumi]|uniref:DUF192 domain-containing protein n=1 Tax=Leekyejoonella antrihumi TaxID=1660198 RepID=A0A563E094_9MICO|nr:DUF192 domain-containing protein [Leekyejoonella antrihumi]TWP35937.1 DUF192 domain-containing protein [Leekyejoonella antrihumi]
MTRTTFGPGRERLLCNGRPIAPVAVADTARTRRKGLLGTSGIAGALWLTRCPSVHMMGMRYPIDAAVVDKSGTVLMLCTLRPWVGLTRPRLRANATIEAAAGSFAQWGVRPGDTLSVAS